MNLERFLRAVFIAIAICFVPIMLFYWSNESDLITMDFKYFYESIRFVLVFYFILSIIGWMLIGFPVHWVAVKFFNQSKWCYFLGILAFGILISLPSMKIELFLLYAGISGLQAILFLWWLARENNKLLKRT
ncbi:hypothetical protein G3495_14320 [Shewanella baltica]|uniref:hypothetical protein n=1 Tax=Shewanella baltica TaxID=62322 RepID=UPI00217F029A|nr:hypothetical protein [Shewanella baltica]MCS6236291.1 hypothetical protein [Shewanella baltica]MCS6260119.1 hypothetical protein [Shewanella baltica]MCS6270596.1 hypothetical protein [Shewanella baltica]